MGEPLPEAEERLEARAENIRQNDSGFDSRSQAKVQEALASLDVMDSSPPDVKEVYNKYRKRWTSLFGSISPDQVNSTYYWTWETDSLEASITYSEQNGQPHSVDLALSSR